MKWKTVLVTAVLVLLVVALILLAVKIFESQSGKDIKNRIKQYELIAKEQRLITEIITLRYDAAVVQAKLTTQPVPATE